ADLLVITRPPDDDALVVDVVGPGARVLPALADGVVDLVTVGDDGVGRHVADLPAGGAQDLGQRPLQRLAGDDPARQERLVAPDAHLHLAVGARVGPVALSHDGVGYPVAEPVRVTGQDHFTHA